MNDDRKEIYSSKPYLLPLILLMCMVGAYTANNRVFDMWVLFVVGVVGYILIQSGMGVTPMVLGFILGRIVESNFRTAVISGHGSVAGLFRSPIALAMIAFGVLVAIFFRRNEKKKRSE